MLFLKSAVVFALISLTSLSKAQLVDCNINGVTVATVDLDTGVCPFTIADSLPVSNEYSSDQDYDIEFYYTIIKAIKYFTDISNAGRTLSIAANAVYGTTGISLYQVHAVVSPPSNSSAAIQKRFHLETRATIPQELITKLEGLTGTPVEGPAGEFKVSVVDSVASSSASVAASTVLSSTSAPGSGSVSATKETTSTVTATSLKTLHLTTTVCSDHKCTESSVPVSEYLTTTTISGVETVFTTYCPLSTSVYSTPVSTHTTVSGTSTKTTTIYATKTTLVPAVVKPTSSKLSILAAATATTPVVVSTVTTAKVSTVAKSSVAPPVATTATSIPVKIESGSTYIKPASTVTIPTSATKPSSAPSAIQQGNANNKFAHFNELLLVIPVVALF
ncbi:hypothetical protein CLIB1423_02S07118 [[Candida] railenensis]|uniref:Uncharacterized protein n=1 Tax=[Candida] railenensis TaxID=45579 RepID=A0A9P0QM03_9ASCO|nr:hypothetical protein CLIB1423_02S07118 [[Candida] railenensis]